MPWNNMPASAKDVPSIIALLEEIDRFYGAEDFPPYSVRYQQVVNLLFGVAPVAHVILARDANKAVGLASYSFLWPAEGVTASLYMKELYVLQGHRRAGIGAQLVRRLCAIARDSGCSRVEWTTDRENLGAQFLYERLGVQVSESKLMYRVDGTQLKTLANQEEGT
jgi:ribosomal protein S18 acetylase RimI-like enzyme